MAIELQVGALGADDQTDLRRALWNHTPKVVLSRTTSLPGSPAAGDIYIIPTGDTDAESIAFYYDADWQLLVPEEGWVAYVEDDEENVQFDGALWVPVTGAGGITTQQIFFVIDGGGTAISTGVKGFLPPLPYACTIQSVTLLADQTGSIVIDIWKDTYANYPPAVGDTITASAKPTLSSAIKSTDSTLTGWTTALAASDILGFNVDSASTVTRVTIGLKVGI